MRLVAHAKGSTVSDPTQMQGGSYGRQNGRLGRGHPERKRGVRRSGSCPYPVFRWHFHAASLRALNEFVGAVARLCEVGTRPW